MKPFWLSFIQLFFTFNAFGIMAAFLSLTEGIDPAQVRRVLVQSLVTATVVALAFLALGIAVLRALGITVADFMVAGGIVLLGFSLSDLLADRRRTPADPEGLGAVPLGVPLITGPAVLTTSILSLNQYGLAVTVLSIIANIAVVAVVLFFSPAIIRVLGKAGAKTIAKLSSLLLAAIGVMMVHRGVAAMVAAARLP